MADWNPHSYAEFSDLRLRPALDLINAIGDTPSGRVVDLGCGTGIVGPLLAARFADHELVGIETSEAMREKAVEADDYAQVVDGDIATVDLGSENAVIYSNAALNWVPDHEALLPRLVATLAPHGWLAFQVPYQHDGPSHALARDVAHKLDPDAFPDTDEDPHVLAPRSYADVLQPFGEVRVWVTSYMQTLGPVAFGHPVRHFTQATYLRPYLAHFEEKGDVEAFLSAYDTALGAAYPMTRQGQAWLPFKRLFVTLCKA